MNLILISGLSGSGKSVALNRLEDSGYYCVDNLPANLLGEIVKLNQEEGYAHVAIGVDSRSHHSLACLPEQISTLKTQGINPLFIFLEALDKTLVKRFSETRRRHPLVSDHRTLEEAIVLEKDLLAEVMQLGHRIDTSDLTAAKLRQAVLQLIKQPVSTYHMISLVFESFGYKHGIPQDADFIFDVRCLPNPYYDRNLRSLTGLDQGIIDYFQRELCVESMIYDISHHIQKWLPAFIREERSYLTVAIGCTGGQHRSVYVAEQLSKLFCKEHALVRHRQI